MLSGLTAKAGLPPQLAGNMWMRVASVDAMKTASSDLSTKLNARRFCDWPSLLSVTLPMGSLPSGSVTVAVNATKRFTVEVYAERTSCTVGVSWG